MMKRCSFFGGAQPKLEKKNHALNVDEIGCSRNGKARLRPGNSESQDAPAKDFSVPQIAIPAWGRLKQLERAAGKPSLSWSGPAAKSSGWFHRAR